MDFLKASFAAADDASSQTNLWTNGSTEVCKPKCFISTVESGERDAVAGLRLITSSLSILGALSIIISAIAKKQVSSPKVHPIFVLSIADCMLSVLWMVGGLLWLRGVYHSRAGCLTVSFLTVILECITVNLTLVYAVFAYAHIKQTKILVSFRTPTDHVWSPCKVFAIYLIAWILPAVLTSVPALILMEGSKIVEDANNCSCWCVPEFANVVPYAPSYDIATAEYLYNLEKLILFYAVVVAAHYLVVFVLLVVLYCKILWLIKKMMRTYEGDSNSTVSGYYGAAEVLIVRGHSQAKQRVILFLSVFVISGFCNLAFALFIVVYFSEELTRGPQISTAVDFYTSPSIFHESLVVVVLIQSATTPLQGFLNALVYGWTREDFRSVMTSTSAHKHFEPDDDDDDNSQSYTQSFEQSELYGNDIQGLIQATPDTSYSVT